MSDLSDRIKGYEKTFNLTAMRRMPLIVRVDGRAFHTFTKQMNKPFDASFIEAMVQAAELVAEEIQGFKVAYIQSDEATFLMTDYDTLQTQGWFDYDLFKVVSITASIMTAGFNDAMSRLNPKAIADVLPIFDSRAFNVPVDDVVNTFLWRARDWERNSVQMYGRANFSQKEMHGKKVPDVRDMLRDIGKEWLDLSPVEKNGTFLVREGGKIVRRTDIMPNYAEIKNLIGGLIIAKEQ